MILKRLKDIEQRMQIVPREQYGFREGQHLGPGPENSASREKCV